MVVEVVFGVIATVHGLHSENLGYYFQVVVLDTLKFEFSDDRVGCDLGSRLGIAC